MSLFMKIPYCFNYCYFVIYFKISICNVFSFVLFFKIVLALQSPLRFHMNFRIALSVSAKNAIEILISIILNPDYFG